MILAQLALLKNLLRVTFIVRYLERLPLGTDYDTQVNKIISLVKKARDNGTKPRLVIDRTGVGRAVSDLIMKRKENPIMVTITGGDRINRSGNEWSVPKRELIAPLILAFQNGKIQIVPALRDAATLTKELLNFKLKVTASGMDTYEAEKAGMHDDLVLSVAMAIFILTKLGAQEHGVVKRQVWPSKYSGSGDINEDRRRKYSNGIRFQL